MTISFTIRKNSTGFCRKKLIWKQLVDFSGYPDYCTMVAAVRVIEQTRDFARTEWFVMLGNTPLSWHQVSRMDRERMTVHSETVGGDFGIFRTKWNVVDNPDGTAALAGTLTYDLAVPVVDATCGERIRRDLSVFIETVAAAHVRNAEAQSCDERVYRRVPVDRRDTLSIDGSIVDVRLADFSRGGLKFRLVKGLIDSGGGNDVRWQADRISANGRLFHDGNSGTHRVSFAQPLNEQQFRELFSRWSEDPVRSDEFIHFYDVVSAPVSTGIRILSRPKM
ncbi:MAG: hypothetical protein JW863_11120 [Chitinispirillaceae bacterium]|nr:hypothetical protein [Chitinispirillaceae bacterium]